MAFTAGFSGVTESSAWFWAQYTGGDANYTDYRYVRLVMGGRTTIIQSTTAGGSGSYFNQTITGLSSNTTYSWTATLGFLNNGVLTWTGVTYSGALTTQSSITATPWSWTSSNGSATATQTQNFYQSLLGNRTTDDMSYRVWNDLVDKASEVVTQAGYGWDTGGGTYLSPSGCYIYSGQPLTAKKYNSVRHNLGSIIPTGITDRSPGDEVLGYHIDRLTQIINQIIAEG